jgi:ketosteroid isomerase-like protein
MMISLRSNLQILATLCGFILAVAPPGAVRADAVDNEIKGLVMQFHNASTNGDIEFMKYITSSASDALAIGSDTSEVIVGHDAIVAWWQGLFDFLASIDYENGGLPVVSPVNLQVGHKGSIAWAAEQAVWHLANGSKPFRLSLVFRKEHGKWKIIQQHFSNGVPNSELPF